MSVKKLKARDRILLSILSVSWVALFASIGKTIIDQKWAGEVVGIFCGISFSFITIYVYQKLIDSQ